MSWTNNQTLLEQSKHTSCQDIFQAACDELGKHYENKGFKYSRSKPKLTVENDKIKLEILFSTSKSNVPGDFVNLEILPNFYAKQIANTSNIKGLLFGHRGLFYHQYTDNPKQILVKHIFGEELERFDEYSTESKMIESNSCNVYGLNEAKFNAIVAFIDTKISPWTTKLATKEGIIELLSNASRTRINALNGKSSNSDFVKFVQFNFPNIDIESEFNKL